MPCVFPILSLKAMALARSGGSAAHARSEALGYSAGVIGTVLALGGALLVLRGAGSAAGWAFQLQNPTVVAGLLLLVSAIALNMAGLFELPSLSVSGKPGSGFTGSLATGALAAFIATPARSWPARWVQRSSCRLSLPLACLPGLVSAWRCHSCCLASGPLRGG